MLNVFQNNEDKTKIRMFRTAYIKDTDGNKIPFRYKLIDREDIKDEKFLKGVEMQSHQKIIKTTCSYPFTVTTKVVINNSQYIVTSFYTENQQSGAVYRAMKQYKYLVLSK